MEQRRSRGGETYSWRKRAHLVRLRRVVALRRVTDPDQRTVEECKGLEFGDVRSSLSYRAQISEYAHIGATVQFLRRLGNLDKAMGDVGVIA